GPRGRPPPPRGPRRYRATRPRRARAARDGRRAPRAVVRGALRRRADDRPALRAELRRRDDPRDRAAPVRRADRVVGGLLALAGIGMALTSIAFLLVGEHRRLVGF